MLSLFGIALSVAISFHTTAESTSEKQLRALPTQTVDVSKDTVIVADDYHPVYTPFIDGYALPESTLDRIARTA